MSSDVRVRVRLAQQFREHSRQLARLIDLIGACPSVCLPEIDFQESHVRKHIGMATETALRNIRRYGRADEIVLIEDHNEPS